MPFIQLETIINSPKQRVFDLSRSVDLHKLSTKHTSEEAIAGKTSGLIGLNEQVTWRAKHFGVFQKLTSKITAYDSPNFFVDEMVHGAFKSFKHQHVFEEYKQGTVMHDLFDYTSPFGGLGKLADRLFLKKYMTNLLLKRNEMIKEFAESEKWREVLVPNQ